MNLIRLINIARKIIERSRSINSECNFLRDARASPASRAENIRAKNHISKSCGSRSTRSLKFGILLTYASSICQIGDGTGKGRRSV